MIKVLYVCPSSGVGGAETFIKQTAAWRDKSQFENHYLLFKAGPLAQALQAQNVPVSILPSPPRLSSLSDQKKVRQVIKDKINERNIDLVHSTMAYGALFSAWACKQMKVPHVWFQHGPASGWMDRVAALLPHQGLVVNSHYTAQTQRQLENPLRYLIARKIPIEKILLGTEESHYTPGEISEHRKELMAKHVIIQDSVIIAMLCRIQKWKGLHLLLEAISLLQKEKITTPFHVLLWGEAFNGNDYLHSLKQKVAAERLPVSFAGNTKTPALSLAASNIVVNASIQPEPFGLSIIEGMMAGTIPVVPDEGGPTEIVSHGEDGLHFKARQASSLMQQLKTLLESQDLRHKLSRQTKETAQQKYTAERAIGHLESFHKRLLD